VLLNRWCVFAPGKLAKQPFERQRRFAGIARLYGDEAARRLSSAHVAVAGLGGVGSWSVEALARSGLGQISCIDLDIVSESNTNRQIQALGDEYGKSKVEVMAQRVLAINPLCRVNALDDYISEQNIDALLASNIAAMIDATDQVSAKLAMVLWCAQHNVPLISVGASGGKFDPTALRIADLSEVSHDRLLSRLRSELRRNHGFARGDTTKGTKTNPMGVQVVYSPETTQHHLASDLPGGTLGCSGYGSSVCVTASFGFTAAAWVLKMLSSQPAGSN